jgi:hypothetical protein
MSHVDSNLKKKNQARRPIKSSFIKIRLKTHARPVNTCEQLVKKLKNLHAMSLGHKLDSNSDEDEDGKPLEKYVPKV